jgi:hypothetical protein
MQTADLTAATTKQLVLGQTARGLAVAAVIGAVALVSPPLSLLLLALMAARALMRAETAPRIDWTAFAGPMFAALLVGGFVGLAGGVGVLFVWRLFADTRWSLGEAKRLALAAGRPGETRPHVMAHLWLTPLYGLALVAYSAPHMVAGLPLDLPHVPSFVPLTLGALAALAFFDWVVRRAADWRLGDLAPAPAAHALSHHVLLLLAYGAMLDLSAGLVAIAAWRLAHAAPGAIFAFKRAAA